ncbi:class I SAM-dependent methyltransferase [Pseudoroseicyclus tamaricis]|uniref:Methyltransferase domain-containing protein n=1 Tax=Pseudoroseicyclus tamaricis TaxID=2705421 RepID=A0A6B2JQG8_9RHOB|nr:class I SAM-dependent methyltransferase [Pseudoroseicyclus tamaricis]NDV00215.1 methyltransferase domain-containing protein [Pseudoroseicyclus tamaricis]
MDDLYHAALIDLLESLWGTGFLSPGGPEEVARVLEGESIAGASVLDIGCGAGGIDLALVRDHGAGFVTGIDVEDGVLSRARALVGEAGLDSRIGLIKVAPGPLPFPPGTFDVVFSKDSIVHIPDKHALMAEVARVLKPGGRFLASDWLIGHDDEPSAAMKDYMAAEDLDFGMASPARYRDACAAAGFTGVEVRDRNPWYLGVAREELARFRGPWAEEVAARLGPDFVTKNAEIWEKMVPVLESGEHRPTHIRARLS